MNLSALKKRRPTLEGGTEKPPDLRRGNGTDDERATSDPQSHGFLIPISYQVEFFRLAPAIGGRVLGGFVNARKVGFCLAIPGWASGQRPYLHGQLLGVLQEYRNLGLGRMMKFEQRRYGLLRGTELIGWTFDPLEIKNALSGNGAAVNERWRFEIELSGSITGGPRLIREFDQFAAIQDPYLTSAGGKDPRTGQLSKQSGYGLTRTSNVDGQFSM